MTNAQLKQLAESGRGDVTTHYRGSGNHDVYVSGRYVGTVWYS